MMRPAVCADEQVSGRPYRSSGKERDAETSGGAPGAGNDYFGARYYGSTMGRFMSPDYSDDDSQGEPIPFFNPSNPQSLNLYSYAHNNPLTGSDPDGHSVQICTSDTSGNQTCTTVDNPTYDKAASGNNGGLNVPSEQQVERTGSGNITDSNGNVVGTLKYVVDGGLDGPANLAGANMIGNGGMSAIKAFTVGSVVGGAVGGAALATGVVGGAAELTTLGDLSPNVQLTEHGVIRLAERGITPGQVQEAVDAAKKAGDVVQKVGKYGTKQLEYTANGLKVFVEQEGANAGKVITAYFH